MTKCTSASPELPTALSDFAPWLLAIADHLTEPAGKVLFRTDDKPTKLYFVREGEAVMSRTSADGGLVLLQRVRTGFLAEASLMSPRYHCEGLCQTDCALMAFPVEAFRRAIDEHPGTRWAWIDILSQESKKQRSRIERLALKTVRERLLHLILTEGMDGRYVLPDTRLQLAADLGVTPEALYRTLASLQRDGVLAIREQVLTLHFGQT